MNVGGGDGGGVGRATPSFLNAFTASLFAILLSILACFAAGLLHAQKELHCMQVRGQFKKSPGTTSHFF
jgi:hypothetical protein